MAKLLAGDRATARYGADAARWAATGTRCWCCVVLDATRVGQLATDNQLGLISTYRYLHEGIDVLAAAAPGLRGAMRAAPTAWTAR